METEGIIAIGIMSIGIIGTIVMMFKIYKVEKETKELIKELDRLFYRQIEIFSRTCSLRSSEDDKPE